MRPGDYWRVSGPLGVMMLIEFAIGDRVRILSGQFRRSGRHDRQSSLGFIHRPGRRVLQWSAVAVSGR